MVIVQQALIDVLGKPFEEIMQDLVLEPLGMANSFYSRVSIDEKQYTNITTGHRGDGSQVSGKRHVYPEMAAAGLWTTAEDLAKFAVEVERSLKGESNKILRKEYMELMISPILTGIYNLGFRNEKIGTESFLMHNGGNEGYSCSMMFHKEKGYGLVFMSNSDSGNKIRLPIMRSVAAAYGLENILQPDYEKVELSEEVIGAFKGNFKNNPDKTLRIFQQDGELMYKTVFDEPIQLEYVGKDTMININRNTKFTLIKDSNSLLMNGNFIERLKEGEKLASDYIEEDNIEQAVKCYEELMEKDEKIRLNLESDLNNAGYNCISRKKYNTAVAFLKINTILFSQSANAWDSLGDAYFIDKQYKLSIEAMKKSLEYNPNNHYAAKIIKEALGTD